MNAEDKLLSLASDLDDIESDKPNELVKYPSIVQVTNDKDSLEDLKSTTVTYPLTDIDYLVIADYASGCTPTEICTRHNITKSNLNKLLRNTKALTLIEELTETTRKQSLASATALENKGIELLGTMVNANIEKGNYETAVKLLFGKLSLTEVTERIAKREKTDEGNSQQINITNLFDTLSGR